MAITFPRTAPVIELGELRLRPWQETDIPQLVAACQDPDVVRWTSVREGFTEADGAEYVSSAAERWATGEGSRLALVEGTTLLGSFGIVNREIGDVELGYWMAPAARGRGIATRALDALRAWTAAIDGVTGVILYIDARNAASTALARRAGFALNAEQVVLERTGELMNRYRFIADA